MSFVDHAFGPTGNSIAAALLAVAVYSIVARTMIAAGASWSAMLVALPICFVGALKSIAVRPLMLELLYLAAFLYLIRLYVNRRMSASRLVAASLVGGIVWANTHGSFMLLPAILAITSAELLIASDARWKTLIVTAVIAFVSFVANPWDFHLYSFAVQSIQSAPTLSYVEEWQRPDFLSVQAIPLILQIVLALIGVGVLTGRWKKEQVPAGYLLGAAFIYLALQSGRHIALLGIAAAPLIAGAVDSMLPARTPSSRQESPGDFSRGLINVIACTALAIAIIVAGWRNVSPRGQQASLSSRYPTGLMESLRHEYTSADRFFNQYDWGGFLIARKIHPIFIDGRSELYGDRQLQRYASIIHLDSSWYAQLDSMGINLVLMSSKAPLSSALARRGWATVARDSVGVLLRKPAS